ncbi:hypothetical protein P879_03986 [Paragonimus westermani]|uniref:tRNA (guanine(26)-N(2))-dimethyltransferase n=1 Tax=Paragonimus westermani TaxID=34504 RepID=A0A8T0DHW6_9TREM|nr:hypothetical protein P879_03986 [Paragonimus westermani]
MLTSRFARFCPTLSSGIVRRSISNMSKIVEGNACIQFPDGVFYNKVQQFNRDITVAVLQHFQLFHKREWVKRVEKKRRQAADSSALPAYEGLRILEALAATGIRAIRFALEVPNISEVIANDLDPKAVELIHTNVLLNSVSGHVTVNCGDAIALMHNHKEFSCRFNVIDIDPYGTASPYLDAAIQCLHDGGLLCVTSTDMAVLCGSTPGTSMGKYGGIAVKNGAVQETGIRMLLHAIQSAASRHSRVIEPLLSLSIDFYARVFVRIWTSAGSVKAIAAKHAICFTCTGCAAYHIQPLGRTVSNSRRFAPAHGPPVGPHCAECGSEFNVWGPFWCGPLHSRSFLRSLLTSLGMPPRAALQLDACESPVENDALRPDPTLNTYEYDADLFESLPEGLSVKPDLTQPVLKEKVSDRFGTFRRIVGMCTMAYEELPDVALYYKADHLSAVLGTQVPSLLDLHSSFLNAGYRVSCSHAEANTFKTDAPVSFVWDVFLTYHQKVRLPATDSSQTSSPCSLVGSDFNSGDDDENSSTKPNTKSKRRARKRFRYSSPELDSFRSKRNRARAALLARPIRSQVDFTLHPEANPPSRVDGLIRFQQKPEKFWGPKARPKMLKTIDTSEVRA